MCGWPDSQVRIRGSALGWLGALDAKLPRIATIRTSGRAWYLGRSQGAFPVARSGETPGRTQNERGGNP